MSDGRESAMTSGSRSSRSGVYALWLDANFPRSSRVGRNLRWSLTSPAPRQPDFNAWKAAMGSRWGTRRPAEYGGGGLSKEQGEDLFPWRWPRAGAFNPIGGMGS